MIGTIDGQRVIADLKKLSDIAAKGSLSEVGIGTSFGGGGDDILVYWARSPKELSQTVVEEISEKINVYILDMNEYRKFFYYEFYIR